MTATDATDDAIGAGAPRRVRLGRVAAYAGVITGGLLAGGLAGLIAAVWLGWIGITC